MQHLYCRCSVSSPDRQTCTGPTETVLELSEGIWSEAGDNPYTDHFKVYIHSCSNDDFSGGMMIFVLTEFLKFTIGVQGPGPPLA